MSKIIGIVVENGDNDFEYWEGFSLTESEEAEIWNVLNNHDTEGCSIRGTRKDISVGNINREKFIKDQKK